MLKCRDLRKIQQTYIYILQGVKFIMRAVYLLTEVYSIIITRFRGKPRNFMLITDLGEQFVKSLPPTPVCMAFAALFSASSHLHGSNVQVLNRLGWLVQIYTVVAPARQKFAF